MCASSHTRTVGCLPDYGTGGGCRRGNKGEEGQVAEQYCQEEELSKPHRPPVFGERRAQHFRHEIYFKDERQQDT